MAKEKKILAQTLPMQEPFIYFFNNRYFLLALLVGFEPARQRYIASQKPNTLPTELSFYSVSPSPKKGHGKVIKKRALSARGDMQSGHF